MLFMNDDKAILMIVNQHLQDIPHVMVVIIFEVLFANHQYQIFDTKNSSIKYLQKTAVPNL